VAGGIELVGVLRARHQAGFEAVPAPGGERTSPGGAKVPPDPASPDLLAQPDERRPGVSPRPGQAAEDQQGRSAGPDPRGGDSGRAAL
jgi:hypothetical protein